MSLVFSQKIRKIQKFSNPQKRFYFIKKKWGRKSKIELGNKLRIGPVYIDLKFQLSSSDSFRGIIHFPYCFFPYVDI